ncbi:MAG: ligase-associated DNA damage response endonuclease PdeM [Desulfobacterales bacterium]|jgi:DNA ligase-associated metallophosphoesterase
MKYTWQSIQNNHFLLMAQRAAFWKEQQILLIADPHFGKAASFRSHGIAIPQGTTRYDLDRLADLIRLHRPKQLLILGDLIHTARSKSRHVLHELQRWRQEFPDLNIRLIQGNHDRGSGDPPMELKIDRIQSKYRVGTITFSHQPCRRSNSYTIAGHVHPAVRLKGIGRRHERFACFYFSPDYAILPAFGSFTGHHLIHPSIGDRVYIVAEEQIMPAPTGMASHSKQEIKP